MFFDYFFVGDPKTFFDWLCVIKNENLRFESLTKTIQYRVVRLNKGGCLFNKQKLAGVLFNFQVKAKTFRVTK